MQKENKQFNEYQEQEGISKSDVLNTDTEGKYCAIQDTCKLLIQAVNQYNEVVKQNKSLQTELNFTKGNAAKDHQYILELEEANMILQEENEKLKGAANNA